jgi:hypothetical protein
MPKTASYNGTFRARERADLDAVPVKSGGLERRSHRHKADGFAR